MPLKWTWPTCTNSSLASTAPSSKQLTQLARIMELLMAEVPTVLLAFIASGALGSFAGGWRWRHIFCGAGHDISQRYYPSGN